MLGLLAMLGMGLAQQHYQGKLNEGIQGLLGSADKYGAGEEGPTKTPGRGLLADPTNVENQFDFAKGLMALPGGARALQSFAPMLQQAIQSKQWQQGQAQQENQFGRSEQRMGQQFQTTREDTAAHNQQLQSNWQAQFDETLRQNAYQRQMEAARMQMAQQAAAAAAAKKDDDGGGFKPPVGYGIVDLAGGGKGVAPAPGTKDFGTAKADEQALVNAYNSIAELRDMYEGKAHPTEGGGTRRSGGIGNEWFGGPDAAAMNAKRGSAISNLGTLVREMGVLDKQEYERLTKQLPEVDSWIPTSKKTFGAGYGEVQREIMAKLKAHRAAYPWLVPPPPPGYKPVK